MPHLPNCFWQGVLWPDSVVSRQKEFVAPQKPKYEQQTFNGHFWEPSLLFTPQSAVAPQLATQLLLQCSSRKPH